MTHKEQLQFHLVKIKWRYTVDRFLEDIYSILVHMSIFVGILVAIGTSLHVSETVRFSHPRIAMNFAFFMIAVTCIVYSLWNLLFYRKSLAQIVATLDQNCAMDEELVYAYDILKNENDIIFQYLAQKVLNKKNMWQNKIKTNITQNLAKISVLFLIFCTILWVLQKQNFTTIHPHLSPQIPQNKSAVEQPQEKKNKQDTQKKEDQKKEDKQKKQGEQKEKGKNKDSEKGKQTKQPVSKENEPKQQQKSKQNPKEKQEKKVPAPGNNKGNDKKGDNENKKLPDVESEDKSLSPLFGEGKNHDSYAHTGGKGDNNKETQQLEEYYRNLEKLPIFFKKQFIPIEDQLAIKRYFNMIRPQQGK